MSFDADLEALHHSDQRAVRTVDSLPDDQYGAPSALPGWTCAHVIAHLALNAEGYTRSLEALLDGHELAIYDSNEARDTAIATLATADPSELRDRFFAATHAMRDTFSDLRPEHRAASVNRLPSGPAWPVEGLVAARRLEVEVHHADLGLAYTAADWPADFTARLLDDITRNHAASGNTVPFAAYATDADRTWEVGADAPVVRGTAGELAWWLLGRSTGDGLAADAGELPSIGGWQRPIRA
ncbi:MAG TPA: maleylpyruvate isomerase family mycothiol-dependent enzyme [Marmoricola sp.]|jgi:maleylpyruvate isomerase|nr:maleylpyruvate isomerase family mycothiol-dependent enzyme [Marmoricola sp.]